LKIKRTNGGPTVFTAEIGITRTQDQKLLRRTDGKLKILGSKHVKRAEMQSAFWPDLSEILGAGRVKRTGMRSAFRPIYD
jgi:hypothetical protein